MAAVDLRPLFREASTEVQREASDRARRGRGVEGRQLARKKRPDGQRVGGRGVPRMLRRGRVRVARGGFVVRYRQDALLAFHNGTSHQRARRVIGIPRRKRAEITKRAAELVVRQLNRGVSRG